MSERSANPNPAPDPPPPATGGVLGWLSRQVQQLGRDAAALVLGPVSNGAPAGGEGAPTDPPVEGAPTAMDAPARRVGMLEAVTSKLRGAADAYVAAKLDEIEARVDAKLDHIEERIDRKIVDLHQQVRRMRDEELRHRLRLLKVTLVFTLIVAVVSLSYKMLTRFMAP